MIKKLKHPAASRGATCFAGVALATQVESLRNPAKPGTPPFTVASHMVSWRSKVMCITALAFLSAWLCAPETRAGSWNNLNIGMNDRVRALAFSTNGILYAGGDFASYSAHSAQWNGTAWTATSYLNDVVRALAFSTNGNLYAGGTFTRGARFDAYRIAQWNGIATWTNLDLGMNGDVFALALHPNGNLFAGGVFTTAGGVAATNVARWDGTSWTNLGMGLNGAVATLVCDLSGNLYAGGTFTNAGGVAANNVAKWNGTAWTNLGMGLNGAVATLVCDLSGNLYAGGTFTNAGGVAANNIARWNGTAWTNLGSGMDTSIGALAFDPNGNLYAGGDFTNAGGVAANRIARWDGISWTNLGSGMDTSVGALACDSNGNLYAGGTFTNAGGVAANRVAKWAVGIGIIPAALTYAAINGDPNPALQTFVVANDGLTAFNFTNTVSYSANSGTNAWFTPAVLTGLVSTPGSLTVTGSVNMANLNEGVYYATNTITATNAANSPQILVVTLRVQNSARLWVSPTNFSKVVSAGQGGDVSDVFHVANTGRGDMVYTITTTNTWLSLSQTNGDVQAGNSNSVIMTYATTNGAGYYNGQVTVAAQGLDVGTQSVAVVLRVNYRPGVAWDAGNQVWTNEVMVGRSLADMTVTVWNASATPAGQMRYTVSVIDPSGFGWVSVINPIGVSSGDPQVATISYRAGLVAGVYTAQLMVSGVDVATGEATTNGPLLMGLQLTVKGTPVLQADVTSLSQTVLENYTGTSSFMVWNGGSDPRGGMRYTVAVDASAMGWASVSPSTGVVTTNADTIQVVWGTTGTTLPPGEYQGNLLVSAVDVQYPEVSAVGSPLVIPLTLTVTARGPLNFELPSVVGTMYIGQTVGANVGLWQNQARLTFAYQWERASNKAGGGREVLSGAVGANYVITQADRGKYLRVDVTATDPLPFPKSATANSVWVDAAKVKALRADFNGDGITDLWFYDEVSGTWHASFGTSASAKGIFPGGPGMVAIPGDYDGDGYEDLGVYDQANGVWHILFLPRGDYVYGSLFGGTAEEAAATPVPADYDGDGATDLGLYYMGYWAIRYSTIGSVGLVEPFADIWGEPVTGDWDGDGITEMGVYVDGLWTLRMRNGSVVEQEFGGGGSGVLPVPGDYDADGITDLAVYDVGANQWRWQESRSGFEQSMSFGFGGVVPMPGYYDHDRSNDWAQVHMSADNDFIVWEVKQTSPPTNYPYLYQGQSYQQSTDRWRVSW